MSSNRNSTETKKMTSISRKLQWMESGYRIRRAFGGLIGYSVGVPVCFVGFEEFITLGGIDFALERSVISAGSLTELSYIVSNGGGTVLFSYKLWPILLFSLCFSGLIFVLRLFSTLFGIGARKYKIKTILKPIDEIALKADELSKIEFTEDKYQILEDAIYNIEPGDNSEISLHNAELQGIETAMNNLIFRMKESYRQQARFVNDASHELRTPIAVIEGYANMLSRWGRDDEKVLDESIEAIQNESAHMKHLVEQLLFLARGDSGKTSLKKENISLNDLLKEIYEESLMIDENHIYKFKDWDWEMRLDADAGLLKQAVRILVDNAAKYTNKGDDIILSCGVDENNRPYLQVQDTGIGMKSSDVEHMFDRFYRADEARNTEGTGLGLSIAKWIVDKHDGHFEVTTREELGTRIRIVL